LCGLKRKKEIFERENLLNYAFTFFFKPMKEAKQIKKKRKLVAVAVREVAAIFRGELKGEEVKKVFV